MTVGQSRAFFNLIKRLHNSMRPKLIDLAHVKRFHKNLFLARNRLRAYDLVLRYDFLSFFVVTKLKKTQVDVLCTAVETRAANWLLSFMPLL